MTRLRLLLIFSAILCFEDFAAAEFEEAYRRVARIEVLSDSQFPDARAIVSAAMRLVSAASRPAFKVVPAEGQRADFTIQVSDSSTVSREYSVQFSHDLATDIEAYTFTLTNHLRRRPVVLRLLWDRLMYEINNGVQIERPDSFARLIATLAHEIYGNVRSLSGRPSHRETALDLRLTSFREGYAGLDRIASIAKDQNLSIKLQDDLANAIVREREGLRALEKHVAFKRCREIFRSD